MKKYIKSAVFLGARYRYSVHAIGVTGQHVTLGGSKSFEGAQEIACNQAQSVFENPWMSAKERFDYLDSMYIYDEDEDDEDAMSLETEEFIDGLMSELDAKIK